MKLVWISSGTWWNSSETFWNLVKHPVNSPETLLKLVWISFATWWNLLGTFWNLEKHRVNSLETEPSIWNLLPYRRTRNWERGWEGLGALEEVREVVGVHTGGGRQGCRGSTCRGRLARSSERTWDEVNEATKACTLAGRPCSENARDIDPI